MAARKGSSKKVRYAVVGLGHIAQVAVLPAFANARSNSELAGLVSGDEKKLRTVGRKYGVEHLWSYAQFDDALRSGAIDAVYIATPNTTHADLAVRAARAGIHVLCEKPLASSESECRRMIATAREMNVKLMTAYRLHFERANTEAIAIAQSGKLGELRTFDSVFSMNIDDPENVRLKREAGGGTLWDIGIYCINAARYLFRAEPVQAIALSVSRPDARFAEVEEMVSAILRFPGDRLATFTCSFGAAEVGAYHLVGTRGSLRVDPAYEYAGELRHVLAIGDRKREKTFAKRDQFAPELVHFSRCIQDDVEPEPSGEEGLADVRIIEALYKSARKNGKPVDLDPIERTRRPGPELELRRPPVAKPREVRVRAPHS